MSKCVFMQDMLKSRCKFVTLLGKFAQQKQVGWEVIFSELGFAGSGARKPPAGAGGQRFHIPFGAFQGSQVSLCSTIKKPV